MTMVLPLLPGVQEEGKGKCNQAHKTVTITNLSKILVILWYLFPDLDNLKELAAIEVSNNC